MRYYIINENSCWADEFNLDAVIFYVSPLSPEELLQRICIEAIMDKSSEFYEEYGNLLDLSTSFEDIELTQDMIDFCKGLRNIEFSFGSNEWQEYDGLDDMLRDLSISEITKHEYLIMTKHLGEKVGLGAII